MKIQSIITLTITERNNIMAKENITENEVDNIPAENENTKEIKGKSEKPKADTSEKTEKTERPTKREIEAENLKLKESLEKAEKALSDSEDKYLRVLAEYDNYRKRTLKEKEGIYSDAYGDAIKEILPIMDNLERAAAFTDGEKILKGLKMTLTQFESVLEKLGIEKITSEIGSPFDPAIQNAVMHTENPDLGENVIAEVLQPGYKKGDKVYRYEMVSVAN